MSAVGDLPGEHWCVVARDPRYRVSDLGRVIGARGRVLRPRPNSRGYLAVDLGHRRTVYVHQLVAEAFLGAPPKGHDTVEHKGVSGVNDKRDNRACNLEWLPLSINSAGWHTTRGIIWDGRDGQGRNVWSDPDHPPRSFEDEEPLTELERAELAEHATAVGW